jgi:hypothetical protein
MLYEMGVNNEPHSCGYIRYLLPFQYPTLKNKYNITTDPSLKTPTNIIIGERVCVRNLSHVNNFLQYIKSRKICFIYTIDDNLLDLDRVYTPNAKEIITMLASNAFAIIVSTAKLKERFSPLNKNIHIVENYLDDTHIKIREVAPDPLGAVVIGYMGTYTHDKDFNIVYQAIESILKNYPNVFFELAGAITGYRTLALPKCTILPLTLKNYNYLKFWKWMGENIFWDIGIAPLETTAFTCCKSDIKFLDYSALGIAGIYSKVSPYTKYVIHNETGLLAENTTTSWYTNLETLITDITLRQSIVKNAQNYLKKHRMLDVGSLILENTILTIYDKFTKKYV